MDHASSTSELLNTAGRPFVFRYIIREDTSREDDGDDEDDDDDGEADDDVEEMRVSEATNYQIAAAGRVSRNATSESVGRSSLRVPTARESRGRKTKTEHRVYFMPRDRYLKAHHFTRHIANQLELFETWTLILAGFS